MSHPQGTMSTESQPSEEAENERQIIYIAIMGVTGAGKSSFISLLCDENIEIGHELESCTHEVGIYTCEAYQDVIIHFIDTPGFDDTNRSDAEVLRELANWFTQSYSNDIKLNGILYFHRISDVKMQGSAKRNLRMFQKLCGLDALKNVVLVTSMWDRIDPDVAMKREKQLMETPEFWGWMMTKGSKTFRHDNTLTSAESLLRHFLPDMKSKVVLDLQLEMVDENKSLDETSAGMELSSEIARERAKFTQELNEIKEEMLEAMKEHNQSSAQTLREMQEDYRELQDDYKSKLQKLEEDQKGLRIALEKFHMERYQQLEAKLKQYKKRVAAMENSAHEDKGNDVGSPRPGRLSKMITRLRSPTLFPPAFQMKPMKVKFDYGALDTNPARNLDGSRTARPSKYILVFSPSGTNLAVLDHEGTVWIIRTENWTNSVKIPGLSDALTGRTTYVASKLRYTMDGRTLAVYEEKYVGDGGRLGSRITAWDVNTGAYLNSINLSRKVENFKFLYDGRLMVVQGKSEVISIGWIETGMLHKRIRIGSDVGNVVFSAAGVIVGIGRSDSKRTICRWEEGDIPTESTLSTENALMYSTTESVELDLSTISPDGQRLASAQRNTYKHVMGRYLRTYIIHDLDVTKNPAPHPLRLAIATDNSTVDQAFADFSANSKYLMTSTVPETGLRIWDTQTGVLLYRVDLKGKPNVCASSIHPEGNYLAFIDSQFRLLKRVSATTSSSSLSLPDSVQAESSSTADEEI